ncbi:3-dehydroquinate synthase [Pelagibacterales bacterium SAG-MED39]|nr:3-dehydroquinate synthase [Pelagibacterales bacterium SAG-MED39]
MKPLKILVKTNTQNYPILIGSNLISKLNIVLKDNLIIFKKCLMVIDKKVPKKEILKVKNVLKNKKIYTYNFNASEISKNQNNINNIVEVLLKRNFSRQDCLITIGGGITGDVGGFAASIFKRGMQFINIPTTLLSQVDSSVGGKTGINTPYGKNLVGNFYQPKLVISDCIFLKTLPKREIICGYGEILKHSLISNKKFYNYLNKNFLNIIKLKDPFITKTIFKSCKIKKNIIEKDEKEKNLRKVLNFGHTFAHAFEASVGYSKKLNHGEAVLLGIMAALKFSKIKKILSKNEFNFISNHYVKNKLHLNIKKYFSNKDLNKILSFMTKDKKNNSKKINLILLKKIGYPIINKTFSKRDISSFLKKELMN